MKKDAPFKWDEHCQIVFGGIKAYLPMPHVLASPEKEKALVYITALEHSVGAFLAHEIAEPKESVLYYLS